MRRPEALRALSMVTPLGWTVLATSVLALAAGAVVGWLELLMAGASGLVTLALCSLFTLGRTRLAITIEPRLRRFVVGRSTDVTVSVRNEGRSRLGAMDLEVVVGDWIERFRLPGLRPNTDRAWRGSFAVAGARRGVLQLGPASTVRSDPLGLLERRSVGSDVSQLYIHPETVPLAPLGTGLLRDLEGRPTRDMSMSDLAFHTLRDYAPGDDRRYIHWRSSAKRIASGQALLVKQFQDTRRTRLLIVVDGDRRAYVEDTDFELAISVGASIAVQAVRDDLEMTFIVADQQVRRTANRRVSKQVVLDACSRANYTRVPLDKRVTAEVVRARETTYAFIITGSRPDNTRLRRVAAKVPGEARATVLRIEPDGRRQVIPGASVSLMTLTELTDLRPLLQKGGAAA